MSKLYLVSVPIGNLEEITYLAKRILKETKCIFCEDTRVTRNLLNLLDIWNNQELIKLNRFNESASVDLVLSKLNKFPCALVSDAGYPIIADPGYFLVSKLRKMNIDIQVVNGPCAFVHAIVSSGIDSRKIFFAGFLTKKHLKRKSELQKLKLILEEATVVYYETSNFLLRGLAILKEVLGDIKVGVCRELSKLHETFYYDLISNLQSSILVRGEFVVIVPRQDKFLDSELISESELVDKAHKILLSNQKTLKEVCRELSNSQFTAKDIYKAYVNRYK